MLDILMTISALITVIGVPVGEIMMRRDKTEYHPWK